MSTLPINEIFETVQGEAHWTGTPSTFVRLQYCDVGCPWCDTKYTWSLKKNRIIPFDTMVEKLQDDEFYANAPVVQLVDYITSLKSRHVVITGGEPASYVLVELTTLLYERGRKVQIETSGTYPIEVHFNTWITLSPKINMPGGREFISYNLSIANELKMPVGRMRDIETLKGLLKSDKSEDKDQLEIWLQPLSQSEKATKLCIEQARLNGWRISLQTHKYAGLR